MAFAGIVTPVNLLVCTWLENVVFSVPYAVPLMYNCDPHVPDVLERAQVQYTLYVPAVEQVSDVTEPNVVLFRRDVDCCVCTFIVTLAWDGTLTVTLEYPSAESSVAR